MQRDSRKDSNNNKYSFGLKYLLEIVNSLVIVILVILYLFIELE